MISMCGNCSARVVSVMDGHRPQIRCEGRWRAPYITARYGSASTAHLSLARVDGYLRHEQFRVGISKLRTRERSSRDETGDYRYPGPVSSYEK
jgi:hypothetical protein